MGEGPPYALWRLDSRWDFHDHRGIELARGMPSEYLRHNLYITTSGVCSPAPLLRALRALGSDHILCGTDYPVESIATAVTFLANAPISERPREDQLSQRGSARALTAGPAASGDLSTGGDLLVDKAVAVASTTSTPTCSGLTGDIVSAIRRLASRRSRALCDSRAACLGGRTSWERDTWDGLVIDDAYGVPAPALTHERAAAPASASSAPANPGPLRASPAPYVACQWGSSQASSGGETPL